MTDLGAWESSQEMEDSLSSFQNFERVEGDEEELPSFDWERAWIGPIV